MIPRTYPSCQSDDCHNDSPGHSPGWQSAMANAIRDPAELLQLLELPTSLLDGALAANKDFSLRVPREYCQQIEKGNVHDPLLRQVLPLDAELKPSPGYSCDPVGDLASQQEAGLLHKYQGRVLVITTPACAVHCRYCFRRHFPYQESRAEPHWESIIHYIRQHPDIHEVILSGGDPLSLTESRLKQLSDRLQTLPHITTLRIHTRLPVVIPQRVNDELLSWLDALPWKVVMVVHTNHPNELQPAVTGAFEQLRQHNITLLNQSVLLAGVNDSVPVLTALSRALFDAGVLPYYLHQLDKVQGARHFEVASSTAKKLVDELRQQLPGYLVPRLVTEKAGEKSKITMI